MDKTYAQFLKCSFCCSPIKKQHLYNYSMSPALFDNYIFSLLIRAFLPIFSLPLLFPAKSLFPAQETVFQLLLFHFMYPWMISDIKPYFACTSFSIFLFPVLIFPLSVSTLSVAINFISLVSVVLMKNCFRPLFFLV
jgi:hypothetical protein